MTSVIYQYIENCFKNEMFFYEGKRKLNSLSKTNIIRLVFETKWKGLIEE